MKNQVIKVSNEVEFITLLAQVMPEDMAEVMRELFAIAARYQH